MSTTEIPSSTSVYKPTEHGNKTEDGEVDQRTQSDHGFGGDKQLAHDAGVKGGSYGGEQYKRDNAGDFTDASTKLE